MFHLSNKYAHLEKERRELYKNYKFDMSVYLLLIFDLK